jgi:hypothetical protein
MSDEVKQTAPLPAPVKGLSDHALTCAVSLLGVREKPPGSNRGPEVDEFLRSVGLDPERGSYPWCAAFVYYCFHRAAQALERTNPLIKTAGVLDHWRRAASEAGAARLMQRTALADPALVKPGMIFVMDFGKGLGHTGLVELVDAAKLRLTVIEGNTNDGGSREGVAVLRRQRNIAAMRGFLDYSKL